MPDNPKNDFRSILCLNGQPPRREFLYQFKNQVIIAADGAANYLLMCGIVPQMIIGDFDSFAIDKQHQTIELITKLNQDITDFEQAILVMQERNLVPAVVCGAFGGEIEHVLNNTRCLIRYGKDIPMAFYDDAVPNTPKWCIPIYHSVSFLSIVDEIISFIPSTDLILSTQGLKWNMHNTDFSTNIQLSPIRNNAVDARIVLEIIQGNALMIMGRYPKIVTLDSYNFAIAI